ncbi:MAG TPA: hypothetical protein VNJ04_04240 [Gemmatimonadaceae bacterium]|nr:hypothetical protein [Gemmatimonadaceae bacterium]
MLATNDFRPMEAGSTINVAAIGEFDQTFRGVVLNRMSGRISAGRTDFGSALQPATGVVRLNALPNALDTITGIFGGRATTVSRAQSEGWELRDESSWFSIGNRHYFKVTLEAEGSRLRRAPVMEPGPLISFAVLDSLLSSTAARISRTRELPAPPISVTNFAFSFGDLWRPTERLDFQGGIRVEAGHAYGPLVIETAAGGFDTARKRMGYPASLSPRLGFAWQFGNREVDIPEERSGSRYTLLGGVGVFRGVFGANLLSGGTHTTDECVGSIPVATSVFVLAGAPLSCSAGNVARTQNDLRGFSPQFSPTLGRRGSLELRARLPRGLQLRGGITVPSMMHLPSSAGLTSAPAQFEIPNESRRPVFVGPARIDSLTGRIGPFPPWRSLGSDTVMYTRSDGRQRANLLQISVASTPIWSRQRFELAYTHISEELFRRGFEGSTFDNPAELTWSLANTPKHEFNMLYDRLVGGGARIFFFGRLRSGQAFTPLVGQDINGDGFQNDRAFLFGSRAADSALARDLDALINTSPSRIAECLRRDFDVPAKENACRAPWTLRLNGQIELRRGSVRKIPGLSIAFAFADIQNLVGGTSSRAIDNRLYDVQGFDPARRIFRYGVNRRFGRPLVGLQEKLPARATITFRLNRITPRSHSYYSAWRRSRGLHSRFATPETDARSLTSALANIFPDPTPILLGVSDELGISQTQLKSLTKASEAFSAAVQELISPVAKQIVESGVPRRSPQQLTILEREVYRLGEILTSEIRATLSREQIARLPSQLLSRIDPETARELARQVPPPP